MKNMKRVLIALLAICPMAASAVTAITPLPIEKRNFGAEKPLGDGPYDLPILTWGGDIATILANGNKAITQPGSLFAEAGLHFKLKRSDVFEVQLRDYFESKSPYLRGTMGMMNLAAAATKNHPDLTPVVFYQLTWSAGGDAVVVKDHIKKTSDLCGKRIAINYDGPHIDYANKVLVDAGCDVEKNTFVWTKDLTGSMQTPMEALRAADVDAAFVIIPDAMALTSGGGVGDGSETSIKGVRTLLSTKTADRVIADVYAVRASYLKSHPEQVNKFASAMFKAQETLSQLSKQSPSEYKALLIASASLLLDAPDAIADAEGLLADAHISGFSGNTQFFQNQNNFRNFTTVAKESAEGVARMALVSGDSPPLLTKAKLNYAMLASGVTATSVEKPKFNSGEVARVLGNKQKTSGLEDSTLFEFEVYFKPNQQTFNSALYTNEFQRVFELASTYGGAIITVEGHSDPSGYLKAKKAGHINTSLNQLKSSALNLSLSRANQVRDAVVGYIVNDKSGSIDPSQLAVLGHGITSPKTGVCGSDPCAPKTEQEWLSNMRVVFRLIQLEAEDSVFTPL
jgi:outer membrane protein OmpA-like peptidoglycan-associated protein